MKMELIDSNGVPLEPLCELDYLYDCFFDFMTEGIFLYRFVYDPEGAGSMDDNYLREEFTPEQIHCVRQATVDDYYPIGELRDELMRCQEYLRSKQRKTKEFALLVKEVDDLIAACNNPANSTSLVQFQIIDEDY